jgi:hypothetical protein
LRRKCNRKSLWPWSRQAYLRQNKQTKPWIIKEKKKSWTSPKLKTGSLNTHKNEKASLRERKKIYLTKDVYSKEHLQIYTKKTAYFLKKNVKIFNYFIKESMQIKMSIWEDTTSLVITELQIKITMGITTQPFQCLKLKWLK